MSASTEKYKRNLRSAPFWVLTDQTFGRAFRIGISVVLARILIPEDFGVYALSLSLLALSRLTGNLGIGTAIVQAQELEKRTLESAFWVNLAASLFMLLNSVVIGFVAARVIGVEALRWTVPALGLTFLSAGYVHINQNLLVRHLRFRDLTVASVLRVVAEGLSSVAFALSGLGYWSFIFGYVIGDVANSLTLYLLSDWRPSSRPTFRYPKRYLRFGLGIFLLSLADYLFEQLPNLIIGKLGTVYTLGLFTFAKRQSRWVADVPKMASKNFLLSALSRVQGIHEDFRRYYSLWIRFILLWGGPVFVLQVAFAPYYVPVVFGEKWVPAVQALQLLVAYMLLDVAFYEVHAKAIIARGLVRLNVLWRLAEAVLLAVVLTVVSKMGVLAIALSMVCLRIVVVPMYVVSTSGALGLGYREILGEIYLAVAHLAAFAVGTLYYARTLASGFRPLATVLYLAFAAAWTAFGFRMLPESRALLSDVTSRLMRNRWAYRLEQS